MKRTKRYGGFRIGDRVKHKKYGLGRVEGYLNGCIFAWFEKFDDDYGYFGSSIAPNQLINLTRIEEENRKITDPLPPISKETAEELIEHVQRMQMENWKQEDHDIMPPSQGELKAISEFVAEALRQMELFLSPLTPYGDPLPSPYTRNVLHFLIRLYVIKHILCKL